MSMMNLERWRPAVPNRWLFLMSGTLWAAVGTMLCLFAYGWLRSLEAAGTALVALAGLVLAIVFYRLSFSRIVFKNIRRITAMRGKVCVFAFQDLRSYLTAIFMAGLGLAIRGSDLPKPLLAMVYLGVGGALFVSSLHYYRRLLHRPGS